MTKQFHKTLQPMKEHFSTQPEKGLDSAQPTDPPADNVVNSSILIATRYGCWTTTAGTTVPPSEQ